MATFGHSSVAAVRPGHADGRRLGRIAEADEHARIVRRRVAAVRPRAPPERRAVLRAIDSDARAEHVARRTALPTSRRPSQCFRLPTLLISSRSRPVVVADDDVDVAVVVDVAERRAAADLGQLRTTAPACARDVLEPAVAEIAEQLLPLM